MTTAFPPSDVRALARLISQVENDPVNTLTLMQQVEQAAGPHYCVGMTGPPGAGKSTLTDQLIRAVRAQGHRVAVIAIDPTSPFTGGAVLGDRVRMQAHAGDAGVFIRSAGSRGARGGLSRATRAIVQIFAAHQFEWIIIETVGVGQSEFDIMELADTTVVVLVPESGDTVQTLKAGLLEVADIFVVNKSDRPGAAQMAHGLTAMIQLGHATAHAATEAHDRHHRMTHAPRTPHPAPSTPPSWEPPVVQTTATNGDGIDTLLHAMTQHRAALTADPQRAQTRAQLRMTWCDELLAEHLGTRARRQIAADPQLAALLAAAGAGTKGVYETVALLLDRLG